MGGVNFTRNRAWWHTAIWDEYSQRHQYLTYIPTIALAIPFYWYGTFINRQLEQNFAAKMYQLDYENRRNRLTHSLIMEHFETHVESTLDIFDGIKHNGFEHTFKDQLQNPLFEYEANLCGLEDERKKEIHCEWANKVFSLGRFNEKKFNYNGPTYITDVESREFSNRKKYPEIPLELLKDIPRSFSGESVKNVVPKNRTEHNSNFYKSQEEEE